MKFVILTIDEAPFTTNEPVVISGAQLVLKSPVIKVYPIQKVLGVVVPELSQLLNEQEAEIARLKNEIQKLRHGNPDHN